MIVYNRTNDLSKELDYLRDKDLTIGFVPTMGALHSGHLSLVQCAEKENDIVVVSIFVNPTQFNNSTDLKNYPRNLDEDVGILKKTSCRIVFSPNVEEIYPNETDKKSNFDFGGLGTIMEGKFRPSHFDGVANVVKRFFEIVKPTKAYFGQKDIQQFFIINTLNNNHLRELNIKLAKCPIIREDDDLAMSSRNVLLSKNQRKSASLIPKTLFETKTIYKKFTVTELKKWVVSKIDLDPNLQVEYIEFVKEPYLLTIEEWSDDDKILACIAVKVGTVRLIDNIYLN